MNTNATAALAGAIDDTGLLEAVANQVRAARAAYQLDRAAHIAARVNRLLGL